MMAKWKCRCHLCTGQGPGEDDYCSCGYPLVHPLGDKTARLICRNCGNTSGQTFVVPEPVIEKESVDDED